MTPSRSPEPPAKPPGHQAEVDRKAAAPGTATQVSRTRRENRALMRDGVVAALPRRHRNVPRSWCSTPRKGEDGEMKDTMIGVDLAKNVFVLHGASMTGHVKFRKKLSRPRFRQFMAEQPSAVVVLEACGGAHLWAREMIRFGHEVRLIAPRYV